MEKYGYIYKFTFLPKNLIYIGKRKAPVFDENYYGSGVMWKRIISDCDKETDITREILEWCETREDLNQAEIKWIKYYNATDHSIGCNVSLGGDGGNFTEETLQKISNTMKTRGSQKGENNGAFGKHWFTDGINTVFSEECPPGFYPGVGNLINDKRTEKLKGKTRSAEQKKNYSLSKLGDKNPMKQRTGELHFNHNKKCYISPDKSECKYFYEDEVPEGWTKGMMYNSPDRNGENNPAYGRHWYNNGEINIFDYDCPEGFTKGMLRKKVIK